MTFDEWVAGGERVPLNGHRLFVRQDGPADGRPVTMIHGFPTSSHDWSPVIPALVNAGCRVTTLDLLGFGASDKPRDHDYSILEQASLVGAVWAHFGIEQTALVAHDYGVSVAQELLARDPARIQRVAWLNGGLYPDLHRPIPIQRLLHSPLGRFLGPLASERTYRSTMRSILGRPAGGARYAAGRRPLPAAREPIRGRHAAHPVPDRRCGRHGVVTKISSDPAPACAVVQRDRE